MTHWLDDVRRLQRDGDTAVLVTVAGTRGSTPRELGAKMLVSATGTTGTIGGGQLEYQCVQEAGKWLQDSADAGPNRLRHFALGPNCGQCCGGVADVLFEKIIPGQAPWVEYLGELRDQGIAATLVTPRQSLCATSKCVVTAEAWQSFSDDATPAAALLAAARETLRDRSARLVNTNGASVLLEPVVDSGFNIFIFGAGHVGSACTAALSLLECKIHLVDSRNNFVDRPWPDNVLAVAAATPVRIVACAPANSHFLVMTHDHALDLEMCAAILQRGDIASCGLIGSRAKRRRFEKRLRALGLGEAALAQLTCPIGIDSIQGKRPAEIAIAVAAQLQQRHESGVHARSDTYAKRDYGRVSR